VPPVLGELGEHAIWQIATQVIRTKDFSTIKLLSRQAGLMVNCLSGGFSYEVLKRRRRRAATRGGRPSRASRGRVRGGERTPGRALSGTAMATKLLSQPEFVTVLTAVLSAPPVDAAEAPLSRLSPIDGAEF
jgi:hypothetical protein